MLRFFRFDCTCQKNQYQDQDQDQNQNQNQNQKSKTNSFRGPDEKRESTIVDLFRSKGKNDHGSTDALLRHDEKITTTPLRVHEQSWSLIVIIYPGY